MKRDDAWIGIGVASLLMVVAFLAPYFTPPQEAHPITVWVAESVSALSPMANLGLDPGLMTAQFSPPPPLIFTRSKLKYAGGSAYLCKADCGDIATSACQDGTAIKAAEGMASKSNPAMIMMGPQNLDECAILAKGYITLQGAGMYSTIIRPTVTTDTTVGSVAFLVNVNEALAGQNEGVFRGVTLQDFTIWDDSGNADGDCALLINRVNEKDWQVDINRVRAVGRMCAVSARGHDGDSYPSRANLNATAKSKPILNVTGSEIIAGRFAFVPLYTFDLNISNSKIHVQTDWCHSGAEVGSLTRAVGPTGNLTTKADLGSSAKQVLNYYVGRNISFVEGAGAGTCEAAGCTATVGSNTAVALATFSPACAFAPDVDCDYSLAYQPGANDKRCDFDWKALGASQGDVAAFKHGDGWETSDITHVDGSGISVVASEVTVIANDRVSDAAGNSVSLVTGPSVASAEAQMDRFEFVGSKIVIESNLSAGFSAVDVGLIRPAARVFRNIRFISSRASIYAGANAITAITFGDPNTASSNSTVVTLDGLTLDATTSGAVTHVNNNDGATTINWGDVRTNKPVVTVGAINYLRGHNRCTSTRTSNGNPGDGSGATEFLGAFDESGMTPNATETNVDDWILPVGLTFNDLRVDVDVAPGAGTSRTITLRDDAADTAVTCTIADTATSCTYTGTPVTPVAGSKVNWELTNTGAVAAAGNIWVTVCASP